MIDLDQKPQHGAEREELGERPIVIASNRLPFTLERGSDGALASRPSAGGLVAALEPVLRRRGGTWVGWPGIEVSQGVELPGPDALGSAELEKHGQKIVVLVSLILREKTDSKVFTGTIW